MLLFVIYIICVIFAYTFFVVVASQSPSTMDSPLRCIPFTECMGICEDDILLGANEDSPHLNAEAVAQAEWRLRLFLYRVLR
jgi:hypothetical protein